MPRSTSGHALLFWPIVVVLVFADRITKSVAEELLWPRGVPQAVFGDWFRWTLVYNPGAAFGLHLGPYSRWIFLALTVGALGILFHLYRTTEAGQRWRAIAIGLVTAGAIGNLIDRIVSPNGVVDFIDIGLGDLRWPTFNVADMAVSTGAILLAAVLWREDESAEASRVGGAASVGAAAVGESERVRS
ncbi:MAG: signal peptidase II [Gemmatimonadetes bacterium]|nr:signal peptidase II [Gemmatimonadota bacterium]